VRAGFHCAALVHRHLGTTPGGTVRASFGPFNGPADAEAVVAAVATLVGAPPGRLRFDPMSPQPRPAWQT
jgi:selenocysteine lyase/cysteine desulfurase